MFRTKWLLKEKVSIYCDLTLHILNSFWETVLKFSLEIFWNIILSFLQYFPEFLLRLRLSFISFSVQVIPYCL